MLGSIWDEPVVGFVPCLGLSYRPVTALLLRDVSHNLLRALDVGLLANLSALTEL